MQCDCAGKEKEEDNFASICICKLYDSIKKFCIVTIFLRLHTSTVWYRLPQAMSRIVFPSNIIGQTFSVVGYWLPIALLYITPSEASPSWEWTMGVSLTVNKMSMGVKFQRWAFAHNFWERVSFKGEHRTTKNLAVVRANHPNNKDRRFFHWRNNIHCNSVNGRPESFKYR